MGDSRRSGRARKAVDYSKFGVDDDFADDDDFAGLTPPPSKKPKTAKESKPKEKVKKKEKTKMIPKEDFETLAKPAGRAPPTSRLSREEKAYEQELRLALELSKKESGSSQGESTEQTEKADENLEEKSRGSDEESEQSEEENNDPEGEDTKSSTGRKEKKPAVVSPAITNEDLDEIEVLEKDVCDEVPGRRKRRAATRKKKYNDTFDDSGDEDDDEDFKLEKEEQVYKENTVDNEEDSDDEDFDENDDDDDEDFSFSSTKKKKLKGKGRGKGKGQKSGSPLVSPSKPKARLTSTVIPPNKGNVGKGPMKSSVSSITLPKMDTSLPLPRSSSTGALVIRKPNWCPPGPAGTKSPHSSVTVKSPGGLRLGLSKKARTKPLHPTAKS